MGWTVWADKYAQSGDWRRNTRTGEKGGGQMTPEIFHIGADI